MKKIKSGKSLDTGNIVHSRHSLIYFPTCLDLNILDKYMMDLDLLIIISSM